MLMKLFKTSNIKTVNECRNFFGIELLSVQLVQCFDKFSRNVSLPIHYIKCRRATCV